MSPVIDAYVLNEPGLTSKGVYYTRQSNSELIRECRFRSAASATLATHKRNYEANRDLIDYIENTVQADLPVVMAKYDYTNDDIGQRTSVVYTGTAFTEGHLFNWGYNDRSELTTADRHEGTNPGSPGTQYGTDGEFDFDYDHIGNRASSQLDGGTAETYTTNEVNQYTYTANPSRDLGKGPI